MGANFDNVKTEELAPVKASENGGQLPGREAADLRGPRAWGEGRVENVDVERQINGIAVDARSNPLDNSANPNPVEVPRPNDLKPHALIVGEIAGEYSEPRIPTWIE